MLAASTSDRRSYLERTLESQLKFAEDSRADLIEFIKILDLSPSATELVERVAQSLEGATLILSEGIDLQVPGAKTRRDARTSLEQDSKAVRIEVDLGLLLEVAGDASYERLQYLFAFVLAHELVHVHQYGELGVGGGELVENRLTSEEIADVELEANVKAKDILQELLLGEDAETRSSVLDFVRDRYGI